MPMITNRPGPPVVRISSSLPSLSVSAAGLRVFVRRQRRQIGQQFRPPRDDGRPEDGGRVPRRPPRRPPAGGEVHGGRKRLQRRRHVRGSGNASRPRPSRPQLPCPCCGDDCSPPYCPGAHSPSCGSPGPDAPSPRRPVTNAPHTWPSGPDAPADSSSSLGIPSPTPRAFE